MNTSVTDELPIAKVTLDPSMIRKIGRDTYSGSPLLIVARELVQNARDAALRKGVDPHIGIQLGVEADMHIDQHADDAGGIYQDAGFTGIPNRQQTEQYGDPFQPGGSTKVLQEDRKDILTGHLSEGLRSQSS